MEKNTLKGLTVGLVVGIAASLITITANSATELARVNGKVISLEDFKTKYNENQRFYQLRAPSKKEVLDDMIKRELGIQEARKAGLHKDPDVIDRMNTVMYQALLEKKLAKRFEKIFISNKQAKTYYSRNPEIRTSHIFIPVPSGANKKQISDARKRLENIRKTHLSGGKLSFAEVAQRFSEGVAAPLGGDLDYQTRDKLDPDYYKAAVRLKKGAVSGIVRTRFGFHIIKLTGRRSWGEVDRPKIKRLVFDEQRKKIFEGYMKGLRKKAKVKVNTALLKK